MESSNLFTPSGHAGEDETRTITRNLAHGIHKAEVEIKYRSNSNNTISIVLDGCKFDKDAVLELHAYCHVKLLIRECLFGKDARVTLVGAASFELEVDATSLEHLSFRDSKWKLVDGMPKLIFTKHEGNTERDVRAELQGLRHLINTLEHQRDYANSERLYRREMELRLDNHKACGDGTETWFLISIYRLCSHYGTSWGRAALVLIGIVTIQAILYDGLGLLKAVVDSTKCENFLDSLATALSTITFQKHSVCTPSGWQGSLVSSFAVLLVSIQTAVLAFAVRRRVRRGSV